MKYETFNQPTKYYEVNMLLWAINLKGFSHAKIIFLNMQEIERSLIIQQDFNFLY